MKFKTIMKLSALSLASYYVIKKILENNNEKQSDQQDEEIILHNLSEEEVEDKIDEDNISHENQSESVKNNKMNDDITRINELYPYLTSDFIQAIYSQKEPIEQDFPSNNIANIYHHIIFNNLDELYCFVEIVTNHDYVVSVDENTHSVKIGKEILIVDGKIISDIFNIANQSALLNGDYQGFSVDLK